MAFDFLKLKQSVSDIKNEVKTSRTQLEKLKQRREEILAAPFTKADVIEVLHSRIDQEATAYPGRLRSGLDKYINGDLASLYHHPLAMLLPAHANYQGSGAGTPDVLVSRLAFFMQKPFKDGIAAAVEQMDWPAGAISTKDRAAELSKLDKQIANLEEQMATLKKDAAQAGVFLDY